MFYIDLGKDYYIDFNRSKMLVTTLITYINTMPLKMVKYLIVYLFILYMVIFY